MGGAPNKEAERASSKTERRRLCSPIEVDIPDVVGVEGAHGLLEIPQSIAALLCWRTDVGRVGLGALGERGQAPGEEGRTGRHCGVGREVELADVGIRVALFF